jgi:hypothetical protein
MLFVRKIISLCAPGWQMFVASAVNTPANLAMKGVPTMGERLCSGSRLPYAAFIWDGNMTIGIWDGNTTIGASGAVSATRARRRRARQPALCVRRGEQHHRNYLLVHGFTALPPGTISVREAHSGWRQDGFRCRLPISER